MRCAGLAPRQRAAVRPGLGPGDREPTANQQVSNLSVSLVGLRRLPGRPPTQATANRPRASNLHCIFFISWRLPRATVRLKPVHGLAHPSDCERKSSVSKSFIKTLYQSPLSKSFIKALYHNPSPKPFTTTLQQNPLSKLFIKILYQNPSSKPFVTALYQNP